MVDYFSPANERRRESSLSAEPVAGRKDRKAVAVPWRHCKQAGEFNCINGAEETCFSVRRILRALGRADIIMESLILAQNERWRRVLSMQVGRQASSGRPRAADW